MLIVVLYIDGLDYTAVGYGPFGLNQKLKIHIVVLSGGPINFYVIDKEDLSMLEGSGKFMYYTFPSRKGIYTQHDIAWAVPPFKEIAFVIDNTDNLEDASVRIRLELING